MNNHGDEGISGKERTFPLDDIRKKIVPRFSWGDLVLPQDIMSRLKDICNKTREFQRIFGESPQNRTPAPDRGMQVIFTGPPGSAKTMAAEVIASELKLPLYLIDLGSIVSKYIGETEKNLAKIFQEAEAAQAVLLFDEADALFGKRTEVSDANDRYANVEINYLLQRMEEYSGISIIAANLSRNLDQAFVRRAQYVVDFPSPEMSQRKSLWRRTIEWFSRLLK